MNPFRSRPVAGYTANGEDRRAWMELQPAPGSRKRQPGTILLCCAALLLLGLAAAQGYVSWRAQYNFVFAAKREHLPSVLEALGLDTGAVIFALLGLAHARMGRRRAAKEAELRAAYRTHQSQNSGPSSRSHGGRRIPKVNRPAHWGVTVVDIGHRRDVYRT